MAPAVVKTEFARALYEGKEAEVVARYPLARLGEPDDIAGAVSFLVSNDAAWIHSKKKMTRRGWIHTLHRSSISLDTLPCTTVST